MFIFAINLKDKKPSFEKAKVKPNEVGTNIY